MGKFGFLLLLAMILFDFVGLGFFLCYSVSKNTNKESDVWNISKVT